MEFPRSLRAPLLLVAAAVSLGAQTRGVTHGVRPARLVIRNATIIDGNGTPARGPFDIVIDGNTITDVVALDPVALNRGEARRPAGDIQIDATGKYVLPGLINAHAHLQSNRSGHSLGGYDYNLKLWLANGITTVREVGSESDTVIVSLRARSAKGEIVAPRIFAYPMLNQRPAPKNAAEARARIQRFKASGMDGVKFTGLERDVMAAAADEAHKVGLRIAHHVGVEETNAWDDIKYG
ncbi:MAG: amidohydrolase family protein, partial [Gemmatimonadales bacterium]